MVLGNSIYGKVVEIVNNTSFGGRGGDTDT